MALSAQTAQYISQLGQLLTLVDPSVGPKGPHGTVAFKLVPTNGYHNGQRLTYEVNQELKAQGYKKTVVEGLEYYLVPDDSSTNLPGTISHYAQRTGVADLVNPVGEEGGVNRALETVASSDHTVAPDAVKKYVKNTDNYEEARKTTTERDQRVTRQIGPDVPIDPNAGHSK